MEVVHEPPRRLLDQGGPVAFDVLLDAPVALLGREALVPWHVLDLLPQEGTSLGLDLSGRDLRHEGEIAHPRNIAAKDEPLPLLLVDRSKS